MPNVAPVPAAYLGDLSVTILLTRDVKMDGIYRPFGRVRNIAVRIIVLPDMLWSVSRAWGADAPVRDWNGVYHRTHSGPRTFSTA